MDFLDKKEYAVYLKHNGYNCAQAVMMVYKDRVGLSEELIKKLGSGFGSGMGGMKATCGALVGANMILGMLNNSNMATKFYAKDMADKFIERSKAISCRDLKGLETHKILCSCEDCIRNAIDILDETLNNM
jgi:C_GCAxxG_C_C family probable redox protein